MANLGYSVWDAKSGKIRARNVRMVCFQWQVLVQRVKTAQPRLESLKY